MANERKIEEDSENFWKVAANDSDFWDAYVSTRPNYDQSFYTIIYNFHAAHSTSYNSAHDVGCGAGQVASELASRFSHVVASDNNETHVTAARKRLSSQFDTSRISYTQTTGENLALHYPPSSADLVAVAEAIVLMDTESGLQSFARLIKSGGTLAAWFYGRPTFSDPAYFEKGQLIIDQIMVRNWSKVIRNSGPKRRWGFKRAADGMESWLDSVKFPKDKWKDVRRIKWNTHGTLPFFGKEASVFDIEPVSNVSEGEEVVVNRDPDFWCNEWDLPRLRKYFEVLFPGFKDASGEGDAAVDGLFMQLSEVMGGEDTVRRFTWPCVLVLATRQ